MPWNLMVQASIEICDSGWALVTATLFHLRVKKDKTSDNNS